MFVYEKYFPSFDTLAKSENHKIKHPKRLTLIVTTLCTCCLLKCSLNGFGELAYEAAVKKARTSEHFEIFEASSAWSSKKVTRVIWINQMGETWCFLKNTNT